MNPAERLPVDLDGLGGPAGQVLGQPVSHGGPGRVTLDGPDARVQRPELVLDLGPGLAADLFAEPLPVRGRAERDHPAPVTRTDLVVSAVPAVTPAFRLP